MKLPLSLYLHLPWCAKKCPYCDFNSHAAGEAVPRARYLDALCVDLDGEAELAAGRSVETVFLGGGTPSLFSPDEIGRLINAVRDRFNVAADAEITMEANPGTVDCGDPAGYRAAGINRLSLGAQSFNNESLLRIGRIHDSRAIVRAANDARSGGFDNINIDVMHGLPGQDRQAAIDDLEAAIALEPEHLSWYQLTLEPNTVFHARPPADLPGDDAVAEMQEAGSALLAKHGYHQYEVSAFARHDRQCRHNLNYWLFGDYLAAGAGAKGKISTGRGVFRYEKPAHPRQYMDEFASPGQPARLQAVTPGDLVFEFMLNALRLTNGFSEAIFCERTGLRRDVLVEAAGPATERGLISRGADARWKPTPLGSRYLNNLQAEFLPAGA